ncbi:hypothetical protein [Nostoc sp. MS1]|uniref:hypothetical protein n=1 Tax=Nostoc sp. MS1 TaxID=2764711 RepID=UPI001CC78838|nr:hypothetical protein [Nostoc sp. MS1]
MQLIQTAKPKPTTQNYRHLQRLPIVRRKQTNWAELEDFGYRNMRQIGQSFPRCLS